MFFFHLKLSKRSVFDDISLKTNCWKQKLSVSLSKPRIYNTLDTFQLYSLLTITIELQWCRCSSLYRATFLMKFRLNKIKVVLLIIQWRWECLYRSGDILVVFVFYYTVRVNIKITDWSCSILIWLHSYQSTVYPGLPAG